ncbi:MAG: ORF6N domain-containing protein [Planctomycetes bacterium]|nr:ORF6N domain-containing protein [Planctomycetota bacterium]
MSRSAISAAAAIERSIYSIRGHRVMLDADLATLYGVTTSNLNKAVTRNRDRFPADFMFQISAADADALQTGAPGRGRGGRRKPARVFTEQGVAMLSTVLNGKRAIAVNIEIMRVFVRLRHLLATNADLARRLDSLEANYDKQFRVVFEAIRQLMTEPEPKTGTIGFKTP